MVANNSSQAISEPSALWSARHEQQQRQRQPRQQDPARRRGGGSTTTTSAGERSRQNQGSSPPRDVASMKAEIAELQSDTTATLDRAIAAAQATVNMGNHISTELLEQREQMGDIDAEARDIDDNLKRTGYNLKHGFTWRGALTSPFRKASKKPPGAAVRRRDIAPVFKDDYQQHQQQDSNKKSAAAPAHGGATDSKGEKERTGLFGTSSPKRNAANNKGSKAGGGGGGGAGVGGSNRVEPGLPEHVPEGFDKQLDDLDGLLDGLSAQANAIGAELRQQNEGIGTLGERVEPLRAETASQAQQIKRRFRVRG